MIDIRDYGKIPAIRDQAGAQRRDRLVEELLEVDAAWRAQRLRRSH